MHQNEQQEKNSLIAKFMGVNCRDTHYEYHHQNLHLFNDEYYDGRIEFDKSWDLLMPVLDKIRLVSEPSIFQLKSTNGATDGFCSVLIEVCIKNKKFRYETEEEVFDLLVEAHKAAYEFCLFLKSLEPYKLEK